MNWAAIAGRKPSIGCGVKPVIRCRAMKDWVRAVGGLGGVGLVTIVFSRMWTGNSGTTVALTFLLVVLLAAATSRFWVAALTSVAALLCFNFFFIPPVGTFSVADPENWVALAAFLAVSLVGSNLSAAIRERERQAVERLRLVKERKQADIARQRDALTSALLASIGHDLRTPLTAIRIAAANLRSQALGDEAHEQADVVLDEAERLARLFQNILEMARIDARAVAAERRWVAPSEIWEAVRLQLAGALNRHSLEPWMDDDTLVFLDPRLTAAAIACVVENAAKYAPAGTTVSIAMKWAEGEFQIVVLDRGPGFAEADLPHIFDRFYRGRARSRGVAGTGLGLSIARGLLLAEAGRVSAENRSSGGARVTIVVPAEGRALPRARAAS
jgi:K+-sensing histidine kinase KdpD